LKQDPDDRGHYARVCNRMERGYPPRWCCLRKINHRIKAKKFERWPSFQKDLWPAVQLACCGKCNY